jgi:hypothetical protein
MPLAGAARKWTGLFYDKGGAVFNAAHPDFGVKANGIIDDRPAIQAAMDAANAVGGGTVLLPSGTCRMTVVAGDRFLTAYPNVWLKGTRRGLTILKVANSQGNYDCVIKGATRSVDLSGFRVSDLTIDQNTTNNALSAPTDVSPSLPRAAIGIYSGVRWAVERVRVTDVDAITSITANGLAVSDGKIIDCIIDSVGSASAHDYSAIYTQGDRITVARNTVRARTTGLRSAVTAFEIHGNRCTLRDNISENMQLLANVTGVAFSSDHVTVSGNKGYNCYIGIQIWSIFNGGNLTAPALRYCSITHNEITVDPAQWRPVLPATPIAGIILSVSSDAPTEHVSIKDNHVAFISTATGNAADSSSCGISWLRPTSTPVDRMLVISGNTVEGSLGSGIRTNATVKVAQIARNIIKNPAQAGSAIVDGFRCGILLTGDNTDVEVSQNQIVDDQVTATMKYGLNAAVTAALNVNFTDNIVRATGTILKEYEGASGAGKACFLRMRQNFFSVPVNPTILGSLITDLPNGREYRQMLASGQTWVRQGNWVAYQIGDADYTLLNTDAPTQINNVTITADRNYTLPPNANSWAGLHFHLVHNAATPGAFLINIKNPAGTVLKAIPISTNAEVDVDFDGANWKYTGYGAL